nr:MAG TPA: hypothetical protein [Caudoviricetes sp.]
MKNKKPCVYAAFQLFSVGFKSLLPRQRENRGNTTFPRFSFCFQRFPAFALLRLSCDNYA